MAEARRNTILDTGVQYLGTVYAKALIAAAEKAGTTETVVQELDSLVEDVLERMPRLVATLESPRIPFETKERLLNRSFGEKMSPLLLSFIKVLARRGRFDCMRALREAAHRQLNVLRGRLEVFLTTAEPIDQPTRELIAAKLQRSLQHEIDLKPMVNAKVLGGLVIRVGDTVYDGSLANQLARLRKELVSTTSATLRAEAERFAVSN